MLEGNSVLSLACQQQKSSNLVEKVALLLKYKANPNFVSINGPILAIAIKQKHPEIVALLLKYGARTDFIFQGLTPKQMAHLTNDEKIISLLKPQK